MAGSDKLYLQPILKDLLDGLSTTMGSIDGIVDGLGEAVGQMKDAVDDVSEVVTTVSGTLTTTNEKLDTANNNIKETRAIIMYPDGPGFDDPNYIASIDEMLEITGDFNRYDQGDLIMTFSANVTGTMYITYMGHGTSGVLTNNPGMVMTDIGTNVSVNIFVNAPISDDERTLIVPVEKGHSYKISCDTNGGSGEDLIVKMLEFITDVYYENSDYAITSSYFQVGE